jgi:GGDEF domain-containing protein
MVAREKARADRNGESLCICLLDIDHFKDMNDRFGHQAGDRILAAFARRVRGALRTMDVLNSGGLPAVTRAEQVGPAGRSAFGRVGGEEFIVLLPDTSLRGALRCAERVRKAVVRRPSAGCTRCVHRHRGVPARRLCRPPIGRADRRQARRPHRMHCATPTAAERHRDARPLGPERGQVRPVFRFCLKALLR